MRKFIFVMVAVVVLGAISCSHNKQQNEETPLIEEGEFGCLCCPVEEAPADSLDFVD